MLNIAAVAVLAGFVLYVTWLGVRRVERKEFSDFTAFYRAATDLSRGADPYKRVEQRPYIYPPLLAFLYAPLTQISESRAAAVALLVNVAAFSGALALLVATFARRLEAKRARSLFPLVCLIALIPVADKVKSDVRMFQTNPLILLCFATAIATLDASPVVAGCALGLAFNVKYTAVAFVPYLLLRKRWMAAAAFALAAAGFALLPAVQSGWGQNLRHLESAFGGLASGLAGAGDSTRHEGADVKSVGSLISVSVTSAAAREWHAGGTRAAMTIVALAAAAVAIAVFIATRYRRYDLPLLRWPAAPRQATPPTRAMAAIEWTGMAVAAIALSPQTNTRHLVLALIPSALGAVLLIEPLPGSQRARVAVGVAMVMMLLGLSLPPKTEHPPLFMTLARAWFRFGGASWTMILAYCLMLPAALRHAAHTAVAGQARAHLESPVEAGESPASSASRAA